MTAEHRLLVGFDDVRAITLECKHCGVRLTLQPDKLHVQDLKHCPACREAWLPLGMVNGPHFTGALSELVSVLHDVVKASRPDADTRAGVRLLLEFDHPGAE